MHLPLPISIKSDKYTCVTNQNGWVGKNVNGGNTYTNLVDKSVRARKTIMPPPEVGAESKRFCMNAEFDIPLGFPKSPPVCALKRWSMCVCHISILDYVPASSFLIG